jgi:hypothetical protein
MKKLFLAVFTASILLMTMSGCRKDIYGCTDPNAANYAPNANVDNNSCKYYGNVMFWFDANQGVGTVTISGQTGTISGFVTGGVPSCGNSVSANFSLVQGTYSYTVTSTGGNSWSGNATVVAGGCQAYELQ